MDENTEENPRDGNNILSSSGTRQKNQTLPNDTMNRTADRTCTQKLTIPHWRNTTTPVQTCGGENSSNT